MANVVLFMSTLWDEKGGWKRASLLPNSLAHLALGG